jgi:hypothetical protein
VCREILYSLHDELLSKAEDHISALLEMEGDQIWTQNSHYMVSSKQHFEDLLVKQLYGSGAAVEASSSSDEAKKQAINTALAQLASLGMAVSPQLLDLVVAKEKQKTAEEDAGLLQLIAGTLAYLKVTWQHVLYGPDHLVTLASCQRHDSCQPLPQPYGDRTVGPSCYQVDTPGSVNLNIMCHQQRGKCCT